MQDGMNSTGSSYRPNFYNLFIYLKLIIFPLFDSDKFILHNFLY